MTILDFVTQDELDELDEDPQTAFLTLVNHAQRRLSERISKLDLEDRNDFEKHEAIQHSFMNIIVASAKRFGIEPFVSMEVPRFSSFGHDTRRQFKADLDHYVTQLMLDNSFKSRRGSVAIPPDSKDKIRRYVFSLRECVKKASMDVKKKAALLDKLGEFEIELEKRRVNLMAVSLFALELFAIPGAAWASVEITQKLVSNVMQVVAIARAEEQATQQLRAPENPKALSAPRAPLFKPTPKPELDDDIPF